MNDWLLENMACPRHHLALSARHGELLCPQGCTFPVVDGVPVMLIEEAQQTIDIARASLRQSREPSGDGGWYLDSVGLSDEERWGVLRLAAQEHRGIDPVVSFLVGATNGIAYKSQVGHLNEYPIPDLRIPPNQGGVLLDIGCNWGRWCVAARRKGFRVVGIDPSLGAVMAANRVARQLGIEAEFVVGDARFLPFKTSVFDSVFSYSVVQHLSRDDAASVVSEVGRVLVEGGTCCVQMPTASGLRCVYHQLRRRFRDGVGFEVRYWTLPSLRRLFSKQVGKTTFSVDCFFGIGLQFSDLRFMSPALRVVVAASEALRLVSRFFPPLLWVADSVYVSSAKDGAERDY